MAFAGGAGYISHRVRCFLIQRVDRLVDIALDRLCQRRNTILDGFLDLLQRGRRLAAVSRFRDAVLSGDQDIVVLSIGQFLCCVLDSILISGITLQWVARLEGLIQPLHLCLYGCCCLIQRLTDTLVHFAGCIVAFLSQPFTGIFVCHAKDSTFKDVLCIGGCKVAGRMDAPEGRKHIPDGGCHTVHSVLDLCQCAFIL